MSPVSLSATDLLTLRVALGHAIAANPEASRDFPFAPESTEKLASLLDLLLLATAPSKTFTLEEAPDRPPYGSAGVDRSLQRAGSTEQEVGVASVGLGDLVSAHHSGNSVADLAGLSSD